MNESDSWRARTANIAFWTLLASSLPFAAYVFGATFLIILLTSLFAFSLLAILAALWRVRQRSTIRSQVPTSADGRLIIPFGHYDGLGAQEPDLNQVMMGREDERATFIDLLLNRDQRGSVLVTGGRGTGKTSFVSECIRLYREDIYPRFKRSEFGKGILDRLVLLVMLLLAVSGAIVLTEFVQVWVDASRDQSYRPGGSDVLAIFLHGKLALILLPLVLAPIAFGVKGLRHLLPAPRVGQWLGSGGGVGAVGLFESALRWVLLGGPIVQVVLIWYHTSFALTAVAISIGVCSLTYALLALPFWKLRASFWISCKFGARLALLSCRIQLLVLLGLYFATPALGLFEATRPFETELNRTSRWMRHAPLPSSEQYAAASKENPNCSAPKAARSRQLGDFTDKALDKDPYTAWIPRNAVGPWSLVAQVEKAAETGIVTIDWTTCGIPDVVQVSIGTLAGGEFEAFTTRECLLRPSRRQISAVPPQTGLQFDVIDHDSPESRWKSQTQIRLDHHKGDPCQPLTVLPSSDKTATTPATPPDSGAAASKSGSSDTAAEKPQDGKVSTTSSTTPPAHPANVAVRTGEECSKEPASYAKCGSLAIKVTAINNFDSGPCLTLPGAQSARSDAMVRKPGIASLSLDTACLVPPDAESSGPLGDRSPPDDRLMIALIVGFILLFFWLEQALILAPASEADRGTKRRHSEEARALRRLAEATLPYYYHQLTLPVKRVSVNLAFEDLDHRRVIHAMLAGLRDVYGEVYSPIRHPLAAFVLLIQVLIAFVAAMAVGSLWFDLSLDDTRAEDSIVKAMATFSYCSDVEDVPPGLSAVCSLLGETGAHFLYFDLLALRNGLERPGKHLSPKNENVTGSSTKEDERGTDLNALRLVFPFTSGVGLHLRSYHALNILLVWALLNMLLSRHEIVRHRRIRKRLETASDRLWATTREASRDDFPLAQYIPFFPNERIEERESQPADSRVIEILFLNLLREAQQVRLDLPFDLEISFPAPEFIFVFDELDKVGMRPAEELAATGSSTSSGDPLNRDRGRSKALHKLLGELKNVISSGNARFVFIGGRNLHDEWLADQAEREPLLSTVFLDEVYIPSLLVEPGDRSMSDQIEAFLLFHWSRAERLFFRVQSRCIGFLHRPVSRADVTFARDEYGGDLTARVQDVLLLIHNQAGPSLEQYPESVEFLKNYIRFLAYRSLGNPKKLKEMLERQIMPANYELRNLKDGNDGGILTRCDHVLVFDEPARFEVELVADAFSALEKEFGDRLKNRDDKIATGIFYLTDFMFKFHRRAFSWANLDRVDELSHIHRSPDLRKVLEQLVNLWNERYLHNLRNGMYDFRFRADFAREVQYLSGQSEYEQAAFNFTLDESQGLKSQYLANIKEMGENVTADVLSALGELYEFDQEYETSRFFYERATRRLDASLDELVGNDEEDGAVPCSVPPTISRSAIGEVLSATARGLELVRQNTACLISRLRLMLQIGSTYEISRDMEKAEATYRDAHTLSNAILQSMLDTLGRNLWRGHIQLTPFNEEVCNEHRLHVLKHMNLLFQPLFAEAWIKEKLPNGVDTSTAAVEEYLCGLAQVLPGVRDWPKSTTPLTFKAPPHANFNLTMAELHNKAGDLYYYKGISFLPLAIRHYVRSILFIDRYIYSRGLCDEDGGERTSKKDWPDFVIRALAGTLLDLGEAIAGSGQDPNVETMESILAELKQEGLEPVSDAYNQWHIKLLLSRSHVEIRASAVDLLKAAGYHRDAEFEGMFLEEERVIAGWISPTRQSSGYPAGPKQDLLPFNAQMCKALTGAAPLPRYPVLAHLIHQAITLSPDGADRFLRLVQQYNAPFLFPPLYVWHALKGAGVADAESYKKQALQMITMGRAFYDLTPDLYYLYDDFNDRRTHFVHSMQLRAYTSLSET